MAKSSLVDSDPTVEELKEQLRKVVRNIVDEEDYRIDAIDQAKETLFTLKVMKARKFGRPSNSSPLAMYRKNETASSCPEQFKCPLSKELMRDPVVVSTGQTYDRPFIQKWLKDGNRTCPVSKQVLSHTSLTANHLVREMISQWCKSNGIELPDPVQYCNEEGITEADRDRFLSLLDNMSSTLPDQKKAAKELRLLTKRTPAFRAMFGETSDAISQLLSPLKAEGAVHADLQEDVITTMLNLSIHDGNKKLVAETPVAIPLLIEALKSGNIDTRTNAAAALFTLSALDSNKVLIGKSGALQLLIELLEEGHPRAMKDVASAIFNLCLANENKARAVKDGAIRVILRKIMDDILVDELLAILAILSSHQKAVEEMGDLGAVPCLLRITRTSNCDRSKENCIAILYTICFNDRSVWKMIREEENSYGTISKVELEGTPRAKRKAAGILERVNRAINITHTA